jgi:hypothetical protein
VIRTEEHVEVVQQEVRAREAGLRLEDFHPVVDEDQDEVWPKVG